MKCDFSLRHYTEMLKQALEDGFKLTNFENYPKVKKAEKILLLRHDVDYSPKRALDIARIEHKLKAKSTFFVRVHAPYYNPFERDSFIFLKQIIELGHEIGLHTEARYLSSIFDEPLVKIFKKEKNILEEIFDLKIISAAEHADSIQNDSFWKNHFFSQVNKNKVNIQNYPQEAKYQKLHYLSDSCQRWREGCLCQNLAKYPKIQVLTHADLWGKDAAKELNRLDPLLLKPKPEIKKGKR